MTGLNNYEYYAVSLKQDRLAWLQQVEGDFSFVYMDLPDRAAMAEMLSENSFDVVVNLAAQAGVRYSIDHPHALC